MTTTTDPLATFGRPARVDALLLAGGRSRRYGADKRLERFGSATLAERALAKLRAAGNGDVYVAGGGGFERPPAVTFLDDFARGVGPLGGILAALVRAPFGVLVLPCDVPLVRVDTLRAIAAAAAGSGRAVFAQGSRGIEPLVGFYPSRAFPTLAGGLRGGVYALHRLLPLLRPLVVRVGDGMETLNVNRRSDLDVARRLEART